MSLQLIHLPKDAERGNNKCIGVDVDFWKKKKNGVLFFRLSLHFQKRNFGLTTVVKIWLYFLKIVSIGRLT